MEIQTAYNIAHCLVGIVTDIGVVGIIVIVKIGGFGVCRTNRDMHRHDFQS